MHKNRALSLGIVGGLVIIGGVVMSVLIHFMVDVLKEGYREDAVDAEDSENWKQFKENSYSPIWAFGLAYIIPGVALFIAALVQNKAARQSIVAMTPEGLSAALATIVAVKLTIGNCILHFFVYIQAILTAKDYILQYVTSAIIALLALLLMGIFVLMAGLFLIVFILSIGAIEEHCKDTMYGCQCDVEDDSYTNNKSDTVTPFKECHYFSSFASLIVALFICIIISWFLLLTAFIMAIYYSCRSATNQPGTVYAPVQQPVFTSVQDQPQYPPPSYNYQPQNKPMYMEGGSQPYYDGPPSKV